MMQHVTLPAIEGLARKRRAMRLVGALFLLAAGLVATWPAPAGSQTGDSVSPDVVGWWSKTKPDLPPAVGNPIPPPDDVPSEGFVVANDPSGPLNITAFRFEAGQAITGTLTVRAPEGEPFPSNVDVVACPILTQWDQTVDGAWSKRPELDCNTIANPGTVNDARDTMKFAINQEYHRLGVLLDTIEIGLTPRPGSVVPFRAVFARPGTDTLVTNEPLFPVPELPDPPPVAPTGGNTPVVTSPPTVGGTPTTPDLVDTSAVTTIPETTPTTGGTRTTQNAAADLPVPDSTGDRIMAAVLLALIGGGLVLAGTKETPTPRLIGGMAGRGVLAADETPPEPSGPPKEGGLGRFRRARSGSPT